MLPEPPGKGHENPSRWHRDFMAIQPGSVACTRWIFSATLTGGTAAMGIGAMNPVKSPGRWKASDRVLFRFKT
jgi:hypothetical protein